MNALEFILTNDEELAEAKFNGYDIRLEEAEILNWMEEYARYKTGAGKQNPWREDLPGNNYIRYECDNAKYNLPKCDEPCAVCKNYLSYIVGKDF